MFSYHSIVADGYDMPQACLCHSLASLLS